jgi:hypothetical protein
MQKRRRRPSPPVSRRPVPNRFPPVPVGCRVVLAISESDLPRPARFPWRDGAARDAAGTLRDLRSAGFRLDSAAPMSRSGPSSVFVQAWLTVSHPRMFTGCPAADVAGGVRPQACRPPSAFKPWSGRVSQRSSPRAWARALAPMADSACASLTWPGADSLLSPDGAPRFHAVSVRTIEGQVRVSLDSEVGARLHVFTTPRRDGPPPTPGTSAERMRRERGVPSLSIEQTTADVQAIHRLVASRPPKATATSPPATGSGTERRSATRPAPGHVREPEERSGRLRTRAPHEEARSERMEAGGALGRRPDGTEAPAGTRGDPRGSPVPARRRARPATEDAMRAARREVSTGTN